MYNSISDALDWILALCKKRKVIVDFQDFYPTCSVIDTRVIFINTNDVPEHNRPFAIAHELGHISCETEGVFYYACPNNLYKGESDADIYGIHLMHRYAKENGLYFDNAQTFVDQMGIKPELVDAVAIMLKNDTE